jgi:hypothetical protein
METPRWRTADEVRAENREHDAAFRELFARVPPDRLLEGPEGEWTVAQNLGHIAEFPGYFARQLRSWIRGDQVVIGRVAEHDPQRNDAIARAPAEELRQLTARAEVAFGELEETLAELTDDHLTATTQNVKYGEEPLTNYLERYVVGHKRAHVDQLRRTLGAVAG